jgi:Glycosyltransferase 61
MNKFGALIDSHDVEGAAIELIRHIESEGLTSTNLMRIARFADISSIKASNTNRIQTKLSKSEIIYTQPKSFSQRIPPEILTDLPKSFSNVPSTTITIETPSINVRLIEDGTLFFARGYFIVFDKNMVADSEVSGRNWEALIPILPNIVSAIKKSTIPHVAGCSSILLDRVYQPNYCHWLSDWVTRYQLYSKSGQKNIGSVLYTAQPSYIQQTRKLLHEFPFEKCTELQQNPIVKFDRLLASENIGSKLLHPAHKGSDWALRYIREKFGCRSDHLDKKRRLFITRQRSDRRRILNELQIFSTLQKFEFESIVLEDLSVVQQAAAFQSAECVISPHGAGLTNLVYCDPGVKVVEMFPNTYGTPAFHIIASAGNLKYTVINCESIARYDNNSVRRPNWDDMICPDDLIKNWIANNF